MNRKITVLTLCAMLFALSVLAAAQQPGKAARIGYLDSSTGAGSAELLHEFRKQMTQLNWIEGKNLTIAYRYAEGKGAKRLAELAAELAGLKVDVIVVSASSTALAAKKATTTIPIVMTSSVDPVAQGLIVSLARPGGNITGLAGFTDELAGKRLEILKEVLPKSTRFGVISGTGGRGGEPQLKVMKEAASGLGLKLVEIGSGKDAQTLLNTFQVAVHERVHGIVTISAPVLFAQRQSIIVLAANHKLPAIYPQKEFVEDGGLMSYGEDRRDSYRRAAIYVDKILKGAKPAEMPVERPTKFEFFANLKTAKQIGLTIPSQVLARADKVIK
ncbi:MAG TPA: ABC transporter substrate-binding protein [Candidatus Binatia bacterium]|nr:ABC transporter substrate-binding protein [Candidatus Binatia bacterium]